MNSYIDRIKAGEFDSGVETRPYLQVLNSAPVGWFLPQEQAERVGISKVGELYTRFYSTGDSSDGFKLANPEFLIIASSPLMMEEKEGGKLSGFEKDLYDRNRHKIITKYLVLLCEKKNPLSYIPLQYTGKGNSGYTFAHNLRAFRAHIKELIGHKKGLPEHIFSPFVFCPLVGVESISVGSSKVSVMQVKGFKKYQDILDAQIASPERVLEVAESEKEFTSLSYHLDLQKSFQREKKEDISDVFDEAPWDSE